MRDNDQDRFFYEWQRHEQEQLSRLINPSREDAEQIKREKRDKRNNDMGNILLGCAFGIGICVAAFYA